MPRAEGFEPCGACTWPWKRSSFCQRKGGRMASRAEGPAQASVAGGVRGQVPGGLRFWAKEPSSRGVTVTPGRGRRGWAACCRRDTWAAMLRFISQHPPRSRCDRPGHTLSRPLPPAGVRAPGSGALQPEPAGMGCVRAGSGTEAGSDLWPGGWCPAGFPSISFPRVGFLRIYNYSGLNSPDSSPLPAPPGQMRFLHASLRVPAHCARGRPGGTK